MTAHHNQPMDANELRALGSKLQRIAARIDKGVPPVPVMKMSEIFTAVCSAALTSEASVLSPTRRRPIFRVRAEAMRQMHDDHGYSLGQIGKFFDRDHTSVLSAVRRAREWRAIIA